MATFSSSKYTDQLAGKVPLQSHGLGGNLKSMVCSVPVTSGLALNDVLNFFIMPKGSKIKYAVLASTDLDSAGPSILLDVGDAGSATRIFSSSTCAGTGTTDNNFNKAAYDYQFTADTPIVGLVHTAAATPVAGTIYLTIFYDIAGLAD